MYYTCNCGGTAPGSILFALENSLGMCLSLPHLMHSLIPFACVVTDKFGNLSKHVSHLEKAVEETES